MRTTPKRRITTKNRIPRSVFALSLIRHVCAVRLLDGEQVVLGLDGDHFCIALFADIGGTSRKGNLCTLRRAGGVSRASKRSEAAFGHPLIGVPGVIAREIDVLPAKRRGVLEQGGIELP
jgi:hypothetical protein